MKTAKIELFLNLSNVLYYNNMSGIDGSLMLFLNVDRYDKDKDKCKYS